MKNDTDISRRHTLAKTIRWAAPVVCFVVTTLALPHAPLGCLGLCMSAFYLTSLFLVASNVATSIDRARPSYQIYIEVAVSVCTALLASGVGIVACYWLDAHMTGCTPAVIGGILLYGVAVWGGESIITRLPLRKA